MRKNKLDDGKIEALIRPLHVVAASRPDLAKEIATETNYFDTNKKHMRYREFRQLTPKSRTGAPPSIPE